MPTPILIEGWEHGVISASGGGIATTIAGVPTISSDIKNSGNYSLRIHYDVPTACSVLRNIAGSPTCVVGRFYFRYDDFSSLTCTIIRVNASTAFLNIGFNVSQGKIYASIGTGTIRYGPVLELGRFYRVDFRADCGANPWTLDWQVDGVDQTQATEARVASAAVYWQINQGAGTVDVYYDDIYLSSTSGDYPIGPGGTEGLYPSGAGTSDAGTNIEDDGGVDVDDSTNPANVELDEDPLGSGTDYIKQTGDASTNYAAVAFADTAKSMIQGAAAFVAYKSAAATPANSASAKIYDEDGIETDIYTGDMSETSTFYKSVICRTPTGGWDTAAVNALQGRVGYATDYTPVPYWQGLMLQVAYKISTVSCDAGSYGLTGQTAAFPKTSKVAATAGSYALTGADADLLWRTLFADPGTYSLTSLSGWYSKKEITIKTDDLYTDKEDYQLRVTIDADTDIGARALSNGYDIRFTASDGVTLLDYERESFSIAAGSASGTFWVTADLLITGTSIYIYYGNPDAPDVAIPITSTYYVDATNGLDANNGLTPATAWKTVTKVNGFSFAAGDKCLFKAGEQWATMLKPKVSGAFGNHVTFGAYNKGGERLAKLKLGYDANGKNYLTFRDLHFSGNSIFADSAEHHLYFYNCIMENMGTAYCFLGSNGPTDIEFYNCVFCRNTRYHIYTSGAATIKARNCAFLTNTAAEGPFSIGAGGNLDLDYCYVTDWRSWVEMDMTNVTDGGHNIFHLIPDFNEYPTDVVPHFCLTYDDNFFDAFQSMVDGVYATYGVHATIFLTYYNIWSTGLPLTDADKLKLQEWTAAGHEMAVHGYTHDDLTATEAFGVTSTNTNPTCDVDVATTTITLWCDEVGNRVTFDWSGDKTIGDLKAAVVGKGWTITNSVQNGKTRRDQLWLECLADSSGAQSVPYTTLLDIAAPDYRFWNHEINDMIDAIETITGVRPVTMSWMYGYWNNDLISWVKANTTLKSVRIVGGASPNLASVPRWKFNQTSNVFGDLAKGPLTPSEETVREEARRHLLYARITPGCFLYYFHEGDDEYREALGWQIDEIQSYGGVFVTYRELVEWIEADHAVVGDNWVKTYDTTGAYYRPLAGSPLIDAGTDVGLDTDIEGEIVARGGGFDIGPYEEAGLVTWESEESAGGTTLLRDGLLGAAPEAYSLTGANIAARCARIVDAASGTYLVSADLDMYFHAKFYFKVNGDWLRV